MFSKIIKAKRFHIFIVLTLVFQLVLPLPVFAAYLGEFVSVQGDVSLSRGKVRIAPKARTSVQSQDQIITGKDGQAKLKLSDDSIITLSENTKFEIKDLSIKDNVRKGFFSVTFGKIMAEVTKHIGGNSQFQVESTTAVCGVRGTVFTFAVVIAANGVPITTVSCVSGSLIVSSAAGSVVVGAGFTATVVGSALPTVSASIAAGTASIAAGGSAGATTAGTAAGAVTATGIGAGTITAGAIIGAGVIVGVVGASGSSSSNPPPVTTTTHH